MSDGALADVKVIDVTHDIAGPYCAKMLADYGADVIKVEEPGTGDIARKRGPFPGDEGDPEKSLLFLHLNTNKRGVTLDLRNPLGARILRQMAADADVLVEDFAPGTMEGLGLGYEALARDNPRLIMTSITGFGQYGPYRDWKSTDLVQYAMSSFMNLSGTPDMEPLQHADGQAQFMAARNAVVATMAALYCQRETGLGQYIDVSTIESIAVQPPFQLTQYSYAGILPTRGREPVLDGAYLQCQDGGYLCMTTTGGAPFEAFAELLGLPELLDPKFSTAQARTENIEELSRLVQSRLKELDRFELFHQAEKSRFVFGVCQTPQDILECPQMEAREYFQELDHPAVGKLKYPGGCFRMTESPARLVRPAPLLGQHNEEVYCGKLGYSTGDLLKLRELGVI